MNDTKWKPFIFFDDYVKATPDGFSCDYREVTHKIPEYHTMIDPRTNEERKGIFIPAGDIQIECWFNPVDPTSPHYQDWHSDNMRVIIKEVDSYNRAYCDNQKKKNYEEKKPHKEVYTGYEKEKKNSGVSSPRQSGTYSASGGSTKRSSPAQASLDQASRTAASQFIEDDDSDDIPF
tara:strand:- start:58 stop:588 length:531 start_codon:yes stop_codon:yes gene_type:complete